MELLVKVLGVGADWWLRPGPNPADPLRYTRHAAYFNTTGLLMGSKVRRNWIVPGVVRFNGTSKIDPHQPQQVIGSIFGCVGITRFMGQNRLLAIGKRYGAPQATHFLVTVDSRTYGRIEFATKWRNNGVRVVAASEHEDQQQVLLLIGRGGRFATGVGTWSVQKVDGQDRIVVTDEPVAD